MSRCTIWGRSWSHSAPPAGRSSAACPCGCGKRSKARPSPASFASCSSPLLAAFLFVGLFYFWLIPAVHFRAMIDVRLYAVMNWSMVLDGLLFWWLVLDPRPRPPARVSFGVRVALALGVMFPQIVLGAAITFSQTRPLSLLRFVRPAVPVDQCAQRSAYRRHRDLDPAGDDECDGRAAGDQRAEAA